MGAITLSAQDYGTAAGLRLGYPLSLSIKHFLNDSHAIEAYIGTRGRFGYRWTNISAAYQVHQEIESIDNLYWYWGLGASYYIWSFDGIGFEEYSNSSFGIQAYGGLAYSFEDLPINVTVDWTPTYFINGFGSGFGGSYGSIGVRYIINRK